MEVFYYMYIFKTDMVNGIVRHGTGDLAQRTMEEPLDFCS